jgi:hypothetical protein
MEWYMESTGPPTMWSEAVNRRYGYGLGCFIHHLPLPSHRPPRGTPALATVIPAVYLAAARLVREPHWDHHGLRSDLRHIGTAIEAGVVLVVPRLLTRLGASGNDYISPSVPTIPQLWHRSSHHHPIFSPNAIVTGTCPSKRQVRSRTWRTRFGGRGLYRLSFATPFCQSKLPLALFNTR